MYHLSILTPEKTLFDGLVYSLIAPGADGYLEILTNHTSILVMLQIGRLTVVSQNEGKMIYAIAGGFLEVSRNQATILADPVELAEDIDIQRAKEALDRAKQRLELRELETDIPRAKKALNRAENRIKIHGEYLKDKREVERHM